MSSQPFSLKTAWLSIVTGILLATLPSWLDKPQESNYDAPWVHPAVSPN